MFSKYFKFCILYLNFILYLIVVEDISQNNSLMLREYKICSVRNNAIHHGDSNPQRFV